MKAKQFQSCHVVRFRRFSNRPYAVFSSLKTRISIGVLAVEMLSVASVNTASAQVENKAKDQKYDLNEIVVTASRVPLTLSEATRPVTVLDSAEIAALPAQSVNDLLKYVAGIDIRQRGNFGVQTDMSIRGGTFDQITILLNGINICDPQTGHNAAEFPVDISEIERIEVLQGPAGRVYGTSSLMGAINIVTRIADHNSADIHVDGGSYGYVKGGARVNYNYKNIKNQVSGGYTRSDGHSRNKAGKLNSDFNRGNLFYQGSYSDDDLDVNWHFGFSDKKYGANTFYGTSSDDQYEHVRKYYSAVQAETKGKIYHFRPAVYWNRSEDRFEYFKDMPEKSPFNYHRSDVYGLNLNNYIVTPIGKTAFGAEFRNEGVVSTTLGEPLNHPFEVKGGDGAIYKNGLNRTHISFHLEHNLSFYGFGLSAGVIAVKNTGNEMDFRFYPGVDASYEIVPNLKAYASYNTSLRMPTFTELYYSVGGHKADRFLKPEETEAVELGLKYQTPAIRGNVNFFRYHGSNMIDWIKDLSQGADAPWESVNHTTINTLGVETSLFVNVARLMKQNTFLRSASLAYAYIDQDKPKNDQIQSKYALEYLRHKVVAQANFHIWSQLGLDVTCRWHDRVGSYQKGTELKNYSPYTLLDARLTWAAPKYKLYVEGNNLLDKTYYDHGNIPQPGLWLGAGVSFSLNL